MANKERITVKLTKAELKMAIEATGLYKPVIRSKAARMVKKRGVNHLGTSHQRLANIQSLQAKLTEANNHEHVEAPIGYSNRRKKQWQNKKNPNTA